tara:strand:- start:1203 stop:1391 length:189 start_codon:yes stop_codon:yes gene_type:complete
VKYKVQFHKDISSQGDFGQSVIHGLTFHEEVTTDRRENVEEIIYLRHGKVKIISVVEDPIEL